jgi:hypothetical protein
MRFARSICLLFVRALIIPPSWDFLLVFEADRSLNPTRIGNTNPRSMGGLVAKGFVSIEHAGFGKFGPLFDIQILRAQWLDSLGRVLVLSEGHAHPDHHRDSGHSRDSLL